MVWATLVGGQRKKHNKTSGFCIAPQQQVLKRYKNQWFYDTMLQKPSNTSGLSNLGRGATQKTQ